MKLNEKALADKQQWAAAGFTLPQFDRAKVAAATKAAPTWVHFGPGNIFRVFPAARQQVLLEKGVETTGIIVAEGYDYEIIDAVFTPHDNMTAAITLKSDGSIDKTVVASVVEALKCDSAHPDFARLKEIFRAPSLKMVSFTITEKGYSLKRGDDIAPDVAADFAAGPKEPKSYMGKVAALVYERYTAGKLPFAMASMDNCSHNGDKLYAAIHGFAEAWVKNGVADAGFLAYVESPKSVSFPWSMIDKITPRPDEGVKKMLREAGFEDVEPVVTAKKTWVAAFVNAEETEYLIIEDAFPNGKVALDKAGIIYTDRATVDRVEKMKVCTCLNPLHTCMAIVGCLLGFDKISAEMADPDIHKLVEIVGRKEGLPVVVDPGIIKPVDFLNTCLNVRFPNPFMPDTPQRIACDTSQKLPIRFGETIKFYMQRPDLDPKSLKLIPFVQAAWCRYLLGIDDKGNAFEPSPDPMLPKMQAMLAGIKLGDKGPFHDKLQPILSNEVIFGVDLYKAGLGEKVENYFAELVSGPGAIRAALHKYVNE